MGGGSGYDKIGELGRVNPKSKKKKKLFYSKSNKVFSIKEIIGINKKNVAK